MPTVAERVQKHRKQLRKNGMRAVQIWVPDSRRADFKKECARQSALVKKAAGEKEILRYLDAAADRRGWKA